jgi:putative membrane protein
MLARVVSVSTVIPACARRLVVFTILLVYAVAALPALAQQQGPAPNVGVPPQYPYGYGHMMWDGPGWRPFMIVGPIFALLALIGIMAIFVWLVRWATQGSPFHGRGLHPFYGRGALEILEERFARGEIDKAEFEDKRKTIGR